MLRMKARWTYRESLPMRAQSATHLQYREEVAVPAPDPVQASRWLVLATMRKGTRLNRTSARGRRLRAATLIERADIADSWGRPMCRRKVS